MFTDLEDQLEAFHQRLNELADRMLVDDDMINDTHTLPLSVNKSKLKLL